MKDKSYEHFDICDYEMAERIRKEAEEQVEQDAQSKIMEQWAIPIEQLDPTKIASSFSEVAHAMSVSRAQWQKLADTLQITAKSIDQIGTGNMFGGCVSQEEKPKKEKFHVPRKAKREVEEKFAKKISKLCEKHSIEQLLTHDEPLVREMASAFYRNINRDTASTSESTSKCGDGVAPEKTTASVRA